MLDYAFYINLKHKKTCPFAHFLNERLSVAGVLNDDYTH
ncbi:hypothetical protein XBP1_2080039 [Xenorhabdus bovienii str. puntauvense]|uniref:Uncharacterized protein n=1 Tax=Xenorhabdus bovienii str. puntauvense TaxID=1398201 RepID=A0A077N2R3_XENBV|nr:hypothetical protein XBP1_2080039 [Xenorhabdus bovienii str. puntauvense]